MAWELLGRAAIPGGGELAAYRRAEEFALRVDGRELMSTAAHGSEEALAALGCAGVGGARGACVLVGGLGLGYTLRAVLYRVPPAARVVVAELVPELVAWSREALGQAAGWPLEDPRVSVVVGDVAGEIEARESAYDAILLDVDNGPGTLVRPANVRLYGDPGLRAAWRALRPGGRLAVWSAEPDPFFAGRLGGAGFAGVEAHEVGARGLPGDPRHTIWIARRES